jgi:hypothetical protein
MQLLYELGIRVFVVQENLVALCLSAGKVA